MLGNVRRAVLGNVRRAVLGNVRRAVLGNVRRAVLGNVRRAVLGNVRRAVLGNVRRAVLGNIRRAVLVLDTRLYASNFAFFFNMLDSFFIDAFEGLSAKNLPNSKFLYCKESFSW